MKKKIKAITKKKKQKRITAADALAEITAVITQIMKEDNRLSRDLTKQFSQVLGKMNITLSHLQSEIIRMQTKLGIVHIDQLQWYSSIQGKQKEDDGE